MMDDEQITSNGESNTEPSPETSQAQVDNGTSNKMNETQSVESIDYSDHLIVIEQGQQVQAGLMCVVIGLILVSVIFNVLKRFF